MDIKDIAWDSKTQEEKRGEALVGRVRFSEGGEFWEKWRRLQASGVGLGKSKSQDRRKHALCKGLL